MRTGACAKCARPRPLANLIVTVSGLTLCPEDRYARDAYAITHQVVAPVPAAEQLVGGTVIDLATRSRRRKTA